METFKSDVVVVGGGIMGATLAWNLQKQGSSVVLVDRPERDRATWGSTFAWSNASSKVRMNYPDAYTRLNKMGVAACHDLAREIGGQGWFFPTGTVEIAAAGAAGKRLATDVTRLADMGYEAGLISASQRQAALPGVACQDDEVMACYPDEAWIDVPRLIENLHHRFRSAGGQLVRDSVIAFVRLDESITAALLQSGDIVRGQTFVVAAGAWSSDVARMAEVKIPLLPRNSPQVPGLIATASQPHEELTRTLLAPGVRVRPHTGHRILLAGDGNGQILTARSQKKSLFDAAEVLLDNASKRLPALRDSYVTDAFIGLRALPEDGQPIIGHADGASNVYAAVTHSGVTLAPVIGKMAAFEILNEREEPALAPFRPSRFSHNFGHERLLRFDAASA